MKQKKVKEIRIQRSWGVLNPATRIETPKKQYRRSRDKKLKNEELQ